MANIITAGNSTNGGTAITTDTSGTLNIVTGSGSGATAVTVDGSGNMVVTGTLTASGGVSGGIRSGTAVASTSGTSIDFTGIPSWVKRITVMFSGVSTSGTSNFLMQIGSSGGVETSGYVSGTSAVANNATGSLLTSTAGITLNNGFTAANTFHGAAMFATLGSNVWVAAGSTYQSGVATYIVAGSKTLSGGTLDRIRITTANGTDTFDAGTINILYE